MGGAAVISNVQISFPTVEEKVQALSALYGALLGMEPYHIGYHKLRYADGRLPEIGFENYYEDPQPRWPDPEHPQQMHLDIEVGQVDAAEEVALRLGATTLQDNGRHRVYADQAGHPFCLYENPSRPALPGRMARIVFDCFSPRSLARFYEELLDLPTRIVDTPERVVLGSGAGTETMLAFQHAVFPAARWPDPRYPEQLHLDIVLDGDDPVARVEALGGMRIRLDSRPDHRTFADPAAHPFCLGIGPPGQDRYSD